MSHFPWAACLFAAALLMHACGKGELDPAGLTSNPFDAEYTGANVFAYESTYTQNVAIPGGFVTYQVIAFRVRRELLPSGAYSVQVSDQHDGSVHVITPDPVGSDEFKYYKTIVVQGQPVCLRLQLFNNQSAARAEEICATL